MQSVRDAPRPPGFVEAVVDPVINALTCAAGIARFSQSGMALSGRKHLVRLALQDGPAQLTEAAEDSAAERSGGAFSTAL
jgi:membrane glycosyltransferase